MYDEFFGIEESEQYAFYRVPKLLFTSDRFWNLSTDAKMLYGLLLDRMALSKKNGWSSTACVTQRCNMVNVDA